MAQKYCMDLFGKDITSIIMDLCGLENFEFDNGDDEIKEDEVEQDIKEEQATMDIPV